MARLRGKGMRRHLRGNIQFALDPGHLEVFLGILPDVRRDMFQGVILGIDRPHNFIQRMQQFAGGVGDRCDLVRQFLRRNLIARCVLAQKRNAA